MTNQSGFGTEWWCPECGAMVRTQHTHGAKVYSIKGADRSTHHYALTSADIAAMREWASDCEWIEDNEQLAELSDETIVRGIDDHYSGGLRQFLRDGYGPDGEAKRESEAYRTRHAAELETATVPTVGVVGYGDPADRPREPRCDCGAIGWHAHIHASDCATIAHLPNETATYRIDGRA